MKQLNISKMKINNEHIIKRPYVIPACRVREIGGSLLVSSADAYNDGISSGDDKGGNPSTPPVKARGFYGSGDNLYHGYGEEW